MREREDALMSDTDSKMRTERPSVGDWLARAGFLVAGVAVGAAAGILLLVVAVAVFWFFCIAFSESHGNSGSLPNGAWKIVLAVVAALGFTAGCYYLAGWQGILIGGASVGGVCGGIMGLGARAAQEKKRRLRESR